jgi:hypothetical protein
MIHTEHRGVFDQQIYDFFENDIESCLTVSKTRQYSPLKFNFPGGTNFTAALAILSVIEMMTSYYFGIEEANDRLYPAKPNQVGKFIKKYFSSYNKRFANEKFGEHFYKVFRHGLSHQWSPKRAGVAMAFHSNDVILFDANGVPALNVPALFNITKLALRDYDKDLNKGKGIDNFIKHFEAINKIDDNDMNEFKKYL